MFFLKALVDMTVSFWDEVCTHFKAITSTFIISCRQFWFSGSWLKKLLDIGIGLGICWISPLAAVGIAVANFIDSRDTMTAAISAVLALIGLELLSFWALEGVALLVALQVSRMTKRVKENYVKRKEEEKHMLLAAA